MAIDAHLHLWIQDTERYPWNPIGGYTPETDASLERFHQLIKQTNVDRAVLVQPTPYGWDNSYLLDCKKTNPDKFRAVVLVNPFQNNASSKLRELREEGADGLRINLHFESAETWRNSPLNSLIDTCDELELPVCLQLTPEYLPMVKELAERRSTKIVLDHMARPEPGNQPEDEKFLGLLELSELPNIFIKFSGLNYFSKQHSPYRDTWELLRAAREHFSAQRCMWGSDFPFVEEHWTYKNNLGAFREEMGFSTDDLDWILEKTAESIWW